jgi:hypothetical protein
MTVTEETKALGEKPTPGPLLFITNPTWTGLESNPGLCGNTTSLHAHKIDLQKKTGVKRIWIVTLTLMNV